MCTQLSLFTFVIVPGISVTRLTRVQCTCQLSPRDPGTTKNRKPQLVRTFAPSIIANNNLLRTLTFSSPHQTACFRLRQLFPQAAGPSRIRFLVTEATQTEPNTSVSTHYYISPIASCEPVCTRTSSLLHYAQCGTLFLASYICSRITCTPSARHSTILTTKEGTLAGTHHLIFSHPSPQTSMHSFLIPCASHTVFHTSVAPFTRRKLIILPFACGATTKIKTGHVS